MRALTAVRCLKFTGQTPVFFEAEKIAPVPVAMNAGF